jgi:undecaprenyl-diphosphatase
MRECTPMQNPFKERLSRGRLLKSCIETYGEFSVEFVVVFSLLLISLSLFYFLIHYLIPEKRNIIDNAAFQVIAPLISERNTRIAKFFSFLGTGLFLLPSYALIIIFLLRKKYAKYASMVSIIVVSSLLLGWLLKPVFHRSRPLQPLVTGAGGYSFPSGHALGGFIFSSILIFLIWKTKYNYYLKWIFTLIISAFGFSIGLSRIYLHVHFATDVIGSLFVTLAWFSFIYIFFRFFFKHELHKKENAFIQEQDMISGNYDFNN